MHLFGSNFEKVVARQEDDLRARLKTERESLLPDSEIDLAVREAKVRDTNARLNEHEPASRYTSEPDHELIRKDGEMSAARRELEEGRQRKAEAQRRIGEIDALLTAPAVMAAIAAEHDAALEEVQTLKAKHGQIRGAIPRLRADEVAAQRALNAAQDASVERQARAIDKAAKAAIAGESAGAVDDDQDDAEIAHLQRTLGTKRATRERAEGMARELADQIAAVAAGWQDRRVRHAVARARVEELRWMAVCELFEPELERMAVSSYIAYHNFGRVVLPRIDEVKCARLAYESRDALAGLPADLPTPDSIAVAAAGDANESREAVA